MLTPVIGLEADPDTEFECWDDDFDFGDDVGIDLSLGLGAQSFGGTGAVISDPNSPLLVAAKLADVSSELADSLVLSLSSFRCLERCEEALVACGVPLEPTEMAYVRKWDRERLEWALELYALDGRPHDAAATCMKLASLEFVSGDIIGAATFAMRALDMLESSLAQNGSRDTSLNLTVTLLGAARLAQSTQLHQTALPDTETLLTRVASLAEYAHTDLLGVVLHWQSFLNVDAAAAARLALEAVEALLHNPPDIQAAAALGDPFQVLTIFSPLEMFARAALLSLQVGPSASLDPSTQALAVLDRVKIPAQHFLDEALETTRAHLAGIGPGLDDFSFDEFSDAFSEANDFADFILMQQGESEATERLSRRSMMGQTTFPSLNIQPTSQLVPIRRLPKPVVFPASLSNVKRRVSTAFPVHLWHYKPNLFSPKQLVDSFSKVLPSTDSSSLAVRRQSQRRRRRPSAQFVEPFSLLWASQIEEQTSRLLVEGGVGRYMQAASGFFQLLAEAPLMPRDPTTSEFHSRVFCAQVSFMVLRRLASVQLRAVGTAGLPGLFSNVDCDSLNLKRAASEPECLFFRGIQTVLRFFPPAKPLLASLVLAAQLHMALVTPMAASMVQPDLFRLATSGRNLLELVVLDEELPIGIEWDACVFGICALHLYVVRFSPLDALPVGCWPDISPHNPQPASLMRLSIPISALACTEVGMFDRRQHVLDRLMLLMPTSSLFLPHVFLAAGLGHVVWGREGCSEAAESIFTALWYVLDERRQQPSLVGVATLLGFACASSLNSHYSFSKDAFDWTLKALSKDPFHPLVAMVGRHAGLCGTVHGDFEGATSFLRVTLSSLSDQRSSPSLTSVLPSLSSLVVAAVQLGDADSLWTVGCDALKKCSKPSKNADVPIFLMLAKACMRLEKHAEALRLLLPCVRRAHSLHSEIVEAVVSCGASLGVDIDTTLFETETEVTVPKTRRDSRRHRRTPSSPGYLPHTFKTWGSGRLDDAVSALALDESALTNLAFFSPLEAIPTLISLCESAPVLSMKLRGRLLALRCIAVSNAIDCDPMHPMRRKWLEDLWHALTSHQSVLSALDVDEYYIHHCSLLMGRLLFTSAFVSRVLLHLRDVPLLSESASVMVALLSAVLYFGRRSELISYIEGAILFSSAALLAGEERGSCPETDLMHQRALTAFLSGRDAFWSFFMVGVHCPFMESETTPFKFRHFVHETLHRLCAIASALLTSQDCMRHCVLFEAFAAADLSIARRVKPDLQHIAKSLNYAAEQVFDSFSVQSMIDKLVQIDGPYSEKRGALLADFLNYMSQWRMMLLNVGGHSSLDSHSELSRLASQKTLQNVRTTVSLLEGRAQMERLGSAFGGASAYLTNHFLRAPSAALYCMTFADSFLLMKEGSIGMLPRSQQDVPVSVFMYESPSLGIIPELDLPDPDEESDAVALESLLFSEPNDFISPGFASQMDSSSFPCVQSHTQHLYQSLRPSMPAAMPMQVETYQQPPGVGVTVLHPIEPVVFSFIDEFFSSFAKPTRTSRLRSTIIELSSQPSFNGVQFFSDSKDSLALVCDQIALRFPFRLAFLDGKTRVFRRCCIFEPGSPVVIGGFIDFVPTTGHSRSVFGKPSGSVRRTSEGRGVIFVPHESDEQLLTLLADHNLLHNRTPVIFFDQLGSSLSHTLILEGVSFLAVPRSARDCGSTLTRVFRKVLDGPSADSRHIFHHKIASLAWQEAGLLVTIVESG